MRNPKSQNISATKVTKNPSTAMLITEHTSSGEFSWDIFVLIFLFNCTHIVLKQFVYISYNLE